MIPQDRRRARGRVATLAVRVPAPRSQWTARRRRFAATARSRERKCGD